MTKEQMHKVIDRLTEEQLNKVEAVLEQLDTEDPRERWKTIPGLRVPEEWPPRFGKVERLQVEGESASEQLIRERR